MSAPWAMALERANLVTPDLSKVPTRNRRDDLAFWPFLPAPWTVSAPWLIESRRLRFFTPDLSTVPPAQPRLSLVPYLTPPWTLRGAWQQPLEMVVPASFVAGFQPFVPLGQLTAPPWNLSAPWLNWRRVFFTPDASVPPPDLPALSLAAVMGLPAAWSLAAPWRRLLLPVFTPDLSEVPTARPPVPLAAYLPAAWALAGPWAPRGAYLPETFAAGGFVPFVPLGALSAPPWTLSAPWQAYLRSLGAFTPDASVPPPVPPRVNFTPFLPPDWALRAPYQPTPRILFPPDPVVFTLLRLLEQHPWELTAPWRTMLRQRAAFLPDASTVPLSDPAVLRRAWEARTWLAPQPWRIPPRWQPITLIPLGPARILIVPSIATAFLTPLTEVDLIVLSQLLDFIVPPDDEQP